MWPFKKKVIELLPRFKITVDGHGDYRVFAAHGYAHEWDDHKWIEVGMYFKNKTFGNQIQAEKAIMDFEEKLVLDVRKVIAEVF